MAQPIKPAKRPLIKPKSLMAQATKPKSHMVQATSRHMVPVQKVQRRTVQEQLEQPHTALVQQGPPHTALVQLEQRLTVQARRAQQPRQARAMGQAIQALRQC